MGGLFGTSEAVLETSWPVLGPSWASWTGRLASRSLRGPSWRPLGGFLARLEALLGPEKPWNRSSRPCCARPGPLPPSKSALLGRLGDLLGRLGAVLGRLEAVLGASWAILGLSLGPLWPSWSVGKPERRESKKRRKKHGGKSTILDSLGPLGRLVWDLGGRFGDLLARFGAILGVLERSFGVSGPSWAVLEASWSLLGPS